MATWLSFDIHHLRPTSEEDCHRICTRFEENLSLPSQVQSLTICGDALNLSGIWSVATWCLGSLQALIIHSKHFTTDRNQVRLLDFIRGFHSLHTLILKECAIATINTIFSAVERFPNLKYMEVLDCAILSSDASIVKKPTQRNIRMIIKGAYPDYGKQGRSHQLHIPQYTLGTLMHIAESVELTLASDSEVEFIIGSLLECNTISIIKELRIFSFLPQSMCVCYNYIRLDQLPDCTHPSYIGAICFGHSARYVHSLTLLLRCSL